MSMLKDTYHPNAYLSYVKNIRPGLKARTQVLKVLERRSVDARTIAREAGVSYAVVVHHLRLLEKEGIVERKGSRPHLWGLTGFGQKRLVG